MVTGLDWAMGDTWEAMDRGVPAGIKQFIINGVGVTPSLFFFFKQKKAYEIRSRSAHSR